MPAEWTLIESFPFSAAQEPRSMHVADSNMKGMMGPGKWLYFEFYFLPAIPPYPFFYLPCFNFLSPKPSMKELKQD